MTGREPGPASVKTMRIIATLVVVGCMVATVAFAAGCGGASDEARTRMKQADERWFEVKKKIDNLNAVSRGMLLQAAGKNVKTILDNSATAQQLPAQVEQMITDLDSVMAMYVDLAAMPDLPKEYQDYAAAMQKAVGETRKAVKAGLDLLSRMIPYIKAGDEAALQSAFEEVLKQGGEAWAVEDLMSAAQKSLQEAQAKKPKG